MGGFGFRPIAEIAMEFSVRLFRKRLEKILVSVFTIRECT